MKVSIHQPMYMPYLGVFYKIYESDIFVFLDDAQYSNGYMFNWNRIKTPQGECRIKIPLIYNFGDSLKETKTRDSLKWKEKHLKTLEMNYKKSPYYEEIMPDIKMILLKDYDSLSDLCIDFMNYFIEKFKIDVKIYKSSDMNIKTLKEQRVIDICKYVGGSEYISGHGAKDYQFEEHFEEEGLKLTYTNYKPIEYNQQWGDFIENLSVLDYVFNHGFDFEYIKSKIGGKNV